MHCSLSASPEATSRHGIGKSIGAYGTPSKKTWFRQAPLRKRTNRFRRMAKRWSKWTPPRVKKYELPVKRNILASKAFCLLEGELLHSPSQNGSWGQKNGSFSSRSPNEKSCSNQQTIFFSQSVLYAHFSGNLLARNPISFLLSRKHVPVKSPSCPEKWFQLETWALFSIWVF